MLNTKNLKLILEYDDFCDQSPENCLNFIEKCVEEIPKIKFNLFTVPKTRGFEIKDPSWISRVKNLISNKNISICVHGLFHTTEEFKFLSKKEAIFRLKTAMNIFEKNNIDFLKVFRGPQWGINEYTFEALIDLNFTHIYSHENYLELNNKFKDNIKIIYYNWNLKDNFELKNEIIIAHGHTHNVCDNGIEETFDKIKNINKKYNINFLKANKL